MAVGGSDRPRLATETHDVSAPYPVYTTAGWIGSPTDEYLSGERRQRRIGGLRCLLYQRRHAEAEDVYAF